MVVILKGQHGLNESRLPVSSHIRPLTAVCLATSRLLCLGLFKNYQMPVVKRMVRREVAVSSNN